MKYEGKVRRKKGRRQAKNRKLQGNKVFKKSSKARPESMQEKSQE